MARPRKLEDKHGFEDWLRLTLPEKRSEDRFKIFKEWRRWFLEHHTKLARPPTNEEWQKDIEEFKKQEFSHSSYHYALMQNLRLDFLPIFHRENRQKRARM
ncbi:MAG: hypothetical protein KGL39_51365, partial [Patescibacteria group bacterium]|nr:hypothetical protein [Patescibacteria group bacterium]